MAAWNRFYTPLTQWMNPAGRPLALAKLYFFESGSTTDPLATYDEPTLSNANTNPVVADSDGTFGPIFLQNLPYNVLLVEAGGDVNDPVWSADPVEPFVDSSIVTSYFAPPIYMEGKPDAAEVFPIWNIPFAVQLPSSLTTSIFTIETLPAGTFTITLKKNTSSIGTIAFATNGTPTVTFISNVNFAVGDKFSVTWPTMQDATGADVALSFVFTIL